MLPPSRITASSQQVRRRSRPSKAVLNLHLRRSFESTIGRESGPANSAGNSESIVEVWWLIMNSAVVQGHRRGKAVFSRKQRQTAKQAHRTRRGAFSSNRRARCLVTGKQLKPGRARRTKIPGSPLRLGTHQTRSRVYDPAIMIRNPLGRGGWTWFGVPV